MLHSEIPNRSEDYSNWFDDLSNDLAWLVTDPSMDIDRILELLPDISFHDLLRLSAMATAEINHRWMNDMIPDLEVETAKEEMELGDDNG